MSELEDGRTKLDKLENSRKKVQDKAEKAKKAGKDKKVEEAEEELVTLDEEIEQQRAARKKLLAES